MSADRPVQFKPGAWAQYPLRLDPSMPVPLYRQLRDQLRSIVLDLDPGTWMPSESVLMEMARVSRATARKAVAELVNEGLLVSRQGTGTFVSEGKVTAELGRPLGFTESMRKVGRDPSTQVLATEELSANNHLSARLGVAVGALVYSARRVRQCGGQPCMLEESFLPTALVPGLLSHDLSGSLYEILRGAYGLIPTWGTESIGALNADERTSRPLRVRRGSALILTERLTSSQLGVPLEYTRRYARPDLVSFTVELSRSPDVLAGEPLVGVAV